MGLILQVITLWFWGGGGAICGEVVDAQSGMVVCVFPNAYELDGAGDGALMPSSRVGVVC